jgi:hypothetical protein
MAANIRLEEHLPFLVRDLGRKVVWSAQTRTVDARMGHAERFAHLVDWSFHLCSLAHIAHDRARRDPALLGTLAHNLERPRIACQQSQIETVRRKALRDRSTDTAAGDCNQGRAPPPTPRAPRSAPV